MPRDSSDVRNSIPALVGLGLGFAVGFVGTGGTQVYFGLVGMWFGLAAFYGIRGLRWIVGRPRPGALWGRTATGNALLAVGCGLFGAAMLWPREPGDITGWIVAGTGMFFTILGANAERRESVRRDD